MNDMKLIPAALIILSAWGCSKSSGPSSSSSSTKGDSLLTKEIITGYNASGMNVDSVVTSFQYNSADQLTQIQQTTIEQFAGASANISIVYNFTYSGNLVSGMTGTVMQSFNDGSTSFSSNSNVNTAFTASGGHIVAYVQKVITTGTTPIPTTLETGNDSAVATYAGSGNIATLAIYQLTQGAYQLISQETFTYSGSNLTSLVNALSVAGVQVNTVTSSFTYNAKISAAPMYIVPGVLAASENDVTNFTQTTTGTNPQTLTSVYNTTYNAANQPVTSAVTLTTSPSSPNDITSEGISYFYN